MIKHDFVLHSGQDFNIRYEVPEGSDMNLTRYKGVCKIRKHPNEGVIFDLAAAVEEKSVTFSLAGDVSAAKQLQSKEFIYDAFIYNDSEHIKIGYGKITLIQDISMHN
jgi:hypothetical protein|nr:MAG TPA: hypothetical protein [Caudoviricetes sp.]